jgi:phospholipid/cholesterol/gamma-HCH transport system substrate-binding protein
MSRTLSWRQAVLLGSAVLLATGLGLFGLFAIGHRHGLWAPAFVLRVGFPGVQGVEVGTRVRVQGVDAGEVIAVDAPAEPGAPVVLRLRIEQRFRDLIRVDAVAEIASEGVIGGKVIDIRPGSLAAQEIRENGMLAARPSTDLSDVLTEVRATLAALKEGQGTIAKLINDPQAYQDLVAAVKQGEQTLGSVQQGVDALKRLPVLRNYVEDPVALLVRPNAERNRQVFAAEDLFEPRRAVLTEQGRRRLDDLAPWLEGLKHQGSDVVVASFADPKRTDPVIARTLTKQQSEAVCNYLTREHRVQKMSWVSSRKVTPLGLGVDASPIQDGDAVPADRIEVLVFVPQGS